MLSYMLLIVACSDTERLDQIDKRGDKPASVTDVAVENTPGGAILRYTLPADDNLLYVMAEYTLTNGQHFGAKSSKYQDSIVIEGFSTTDAVDVSLYSVGRNGKKSDPLTVEISPLTSPIAEAFASLEMQETFGGAKFYFENPSESEVRFVILLDSLNDGNWVELEGFNTALRQSVFSVRGLPPKEQTFGVYVTDRWENRTEMITAKLTPLEEELIPKERWSLVTLPTDTWQSTGGGLAQYAPDKMWDEVYTNVDRMFASVNGSAIPQWVTVDLGQEVRLSRFKLWHRYTAEFASSNVKDFEIWGSLNPNPDGSFDDSWWLLGDFETVKPSGTGPVTSDDVAFAREGIDFEFVPAEGVEDPQKVTRYIRIVSKSNWAGSIGVGNIYINEITFWGAIAN